MLGDDEENEDDKEDILRDHAKGVSQPLLKPMITKVLLGGLILCHANVEVVITFPQ